MGTNDHVFKTQVRLCGLFERAFGDKHATTLENLVVVDAHRGHGFLSLE